MAVCLAACTKNETPVEPQEPVIMTAEENKARLQQIGEEFLNAIPASDFKELADLADFVVRQYCMGEDKTEPLIQYAKECFQDISDTYGGEENEHWYYSIDPFQSARKLLTVGKAYAHAKWNGQQWEVIEKDTKDIRMECPGPDGGLVQLIVTPDAEKKSNNSIELSADVVISLDQKQLFRTQISLIMNSRTGSEFNVSRDNIQCTYTAWVAGYVFRDNRISAKANTDDGARVEATVLKAGRTLLSFTVKGRANIKPYSGSLEDAVETGDDFFQGYGLSSVYLNILGQLQINGACKDLHTLMDSFDKAQDTERDIVGRNEALQVANEQVDVTFGYSGNFTPQGSVVMELIGHRDETSQEIVSYDIQPVFVFADGSRYSLSDDSFFNRDNWGYIIDLFEKLRKDYEELADR